MQFLIFFLRFFFPCSFACSSCIVFVGLGIITKIEQKHKTETADNKTPKTIIIALYFLFVVAIRSSYYRLLYLIKYILSDSLVFVYQFQSHTIVKRVFKDTKMSSTSRIITPLGIIILLHSAYSCLHYRSIISTSSLDDFLQEKGYNVSSPPKDVIIEVLIGFICCLFGQLLQVGKFLPVVGSERVELRAPVHVTRDFDLFCTRMKIVADAKKARKID